MENQYKEVFFDKYCKSCLYRDQQEVEDPCYECLTAPVNLYSHKPINYVEDSDK